MASMIHHADARTPLVAIPWATQVSSDALARIMEVLTDAETRLRDFKEELFNLRFQHEIGQLENPRKIKQTKQDVARLQTVIRAAALNSQNAKA